MATRNSEPDLAIRIGTAIVEALDSDTEVRVVASTPRTASEVGVNTIRDIEIPLPIEQRFKVWFEDGCLHVLTKRKHVTVCGSIGIEGSTA